jgi:hypothetical protein
VVEKIVAMKLFPRATAFLSVVISFGYASLIVPDTSDLTSYDVLSVAGSTGMNQRSFEDSLH